MYLIYLNLQGLYWATLDVWMIPDRLPFTTVCLASSQWLVEEKEMTTLLNSHEQTWVCLQRSHTPTHTQTDITHTEIRAEKQHTYLQPCWQRWNSHSPWFKLYQSQSKRWKEKRWTVQRGMTREKRKITGIRQKRDEWRDEERVRMREVLSDGWVRMCLSCYTSLESLRERQDAYTGGERDWERKGRREV